MRQSFISLSVVFFICQSCGENEPIEPDPKSIVTYEVGDFALGGIIAYILQPGDPGYNADVQHGLVVEPYNENTLFMWGCYGTVISGADGTGIGAGSQNTNEIIAGCTSGNIAARRCATFELGEYKDWFLPSIDELDKLYLNKAVINAAALAAALIFLSMPIIGARRSTMSLMAKAGAMHGPRYFPMAASSSVLRKSLPMHVQLGLSRKRLFTSKG
ncbi:MAG: hypothetical protein O2887_03025 [Bacteroidetes bacterium]|nr:hypothetical protein [Bacteroidota bacterium]MDA1119460.1 hypothetical protein [Bacteroidota bacterium]